MTIEFTEDEIKVILGMLDLATKSGGLQVAQHSLPIAMKLQTALNSELKPSEE